MLYEYKCDNCDTQFDCEHPITQEVGAECPTCGNFTKKRLISSGTFVLKGSGWAKDLYAKK